MTQSVPRRIRHVQEASLLRLAGNTAEMGQELEPFYTVHLAGGSINGPWWRRVWLVLRPPGKVQLGYNRHPKAMTVV